MSNVVSTYSRNIAASLFHRDDRHKLAPAAICRIGCHGIRPGHAAYLVAQRIDRHSVLDDRPDVCAQPCIGEQSVKASVQSMPDACCVDSQLPPGIIVPHKIR